MDKNTIIGLLLMFALLMGYSFWNSSNQKKLKEQDLQQIVANELEKKDSTTTIPTPSSNSDADTEITQDSLSKSDNLLKTNEESYFYTPESKDSVEKYIVETKIAKYSISKWGGYLSEIEFYDIYSYTPKGEPKKRLRLFDGTNNQMSMELMLKNQSRIFTKNCYFKSEQPEWIKVEDGKPQKLSLKLYPKMNSDSLSGYDSNSYLEYLYTFSSDDYRVGFEIRLVNMSKYIYPNTQTFTIDWNSNPKSVEKNFKTEKDLTSVFYMDNLSKVNNLNEIKAEKKDFTTGLKWVSFKQQFFTTVLIADSGYFSSGQLSVDVPDENHKPIMKNLSANLDFQISDLDNGIFGMTLFSGPNQYKLLKEYDLNLERQVPLGWSFLLHWINRLAVIPLFNWLESYGLSYGIIILILTIILKIVLLPIAYKTYTSSAKMRVLKPEIEEISAKYPKQEDAMKKQQATMSLYKSAGVNPMSGCLPVLLQMPILIAMFRFFPSAYELRQQPFLWADDLSTYDSVLELGFNIPFYGDHVSLFCVLMTIATLVYTWLNNKMMTTGSADQMKMMKVFMYMMPIMFLGMFNSFSSGLTYYYLLVNLITFLQMFIFRYAIDEKKLRSKLKANMLKPVKKSKWQARMDEILKQQQLQQNNKKK
ncbi:MAG TPA: membrane protein insertase YidC [Bacteroidales bacterium]|nr:membrane protein insertase YidC [Bacteroidales bacterium]